MELVLQRGSIAVGALLVVVGLLTACATAPAPDFHGHWQPVNRYAPVAQEIPLYPAYVFYAAPMDGTLKTMLSRWADDAHITLSYEITSDFSLYAPVAQVRTPSLQDALAQLTALYADQGIALSLDQDRITVRHAQTMTHRPAAAPAK